MRILHILKDSLPLVIGSTIRTEQILINQKKIINKVYGYTGFNFKSDKYMEKINGNIYFRFNKKFIKFFQIYNKFLRLIKRVTYKIFKINISIANCFLEYIVYIIFKQDLIKHIKNLKIDILHQHSQHQMGRFSVKIAKKLNIPFVYEVRAFLEDGMIADKTKWNFKNKNMLKFHYYNMRENDTEIMEKSDTIVTLNEPMKEEIISRGIKKDKIYVIPNSVNIKRDKVQIFEKDKFLMYDLNLFGKFVVGYVGSIEWHEGIEILIESFLRLVFNDPDCLLLLVGRCEKNYYNFLKKLIEKYGVEFNVLFIGKVSHDEIKKYYSVIDVIVIPRLNRRVNRLVTPIKPIEAMFYGKPVVVSDLPALSYVVKNEDVGMLFFSENPHDLFIKLLYLKNNSKKRFEIGNNAKKYIEENFSWKNNIKIYKEIYSKLLEK